MAYNKVAVSAEEEAYQYVQQEIRQGRLLPGQRVVTEAIAARIGTSRMPVRSALLRLASEGLLDMRANRGAVVRSLNARELLEVFEIRAVLEGLAVRNAVRNMESSHLRRLAGMIDHIDKGSGDYLDWTTAHREFHEYLCGFCQQPRLLAQLADLHSLMEPYMRMWATQPGRVPRMREAHEELVAALETGDPGACEAAMRRHVMNTVDALLPYLPDQPR
ncbi:GntR family transcriptional regulator [Achromobacter aloeverae]|uniref:GntR family transcriptional regulator n=1 Tax=Achromobacter aloeverae TaxID=1750518 RepID=A0A4V1MSQ1_9BURK|nr:GntR family transcriptional regulator [Achromobacter aloeverae]RXN92820.1 GntR family transcriptional regulator [Achromobacter aloeverae]